jgi:anti-sigma B factor antagonist
MAQVDFSMSKQTIGDVPVVTLHGEADIYSAPLLRDGLATLLESGARAVVVDLTDVAFLDSTGLGELVSARNRAVEGAQAFPIACDDGRILKLFRITGLEQVFEIHPTVNAAVQSVQPQDPVN